MTYALFKGNKQITKAHSTYDAAQIEAYEFGVVYQGGRSSESFIDGNYQIKEIV